jgi:hypothetical protein
MEIGFMRDMTGLQKMLTPPLPLILPTLLSGVAVVVHTALYFPFWTVFSFNALLIVI